MKLIFDDFPADLFNLIMHGEFYRATEKDFTRLMRIFNSCVIVNQEPKSEATPLCGAQDEAICEEMTADGHCSYTGHCPNKESTRPNEQIAWEQGYEAGLAQGKQEKPQDESVDISKLRLMTVEECAGHTIDYAMGWKACIEWIKRGCAE